MRIAMFCWESLHSISVGGMGVHVSELSEVLSRRGHDVHVFTRKGAHQQIYDCINGVRYHRCPFEPNAEFLPYIGRMCEAFVARFRAAEEFYGRAFDIVHGHDWLAAQALERLKRELGRPVILSIHSTEYGRCGNEFREGLSREIRQIESRATTIANRIICVSRALAEEVKAIYEASPEKITVLYNGIDVRRFDSEVDATSVRTRVGVGSSDPFVLFAGRLAWQKGPDLLLGAVPYVLHHYPDAKVVFAGDGDMRGVLQGAAMSDKLFGAVRFLGHRSGVELVELFRSADVVCVPSRNEPFGIVVLEGWGARKPVIVTPNGGPAEFVRDQENGLVVSADRESIAWGVGSALADADNAMRIAQNGRTEAETRFSWDIVAEGTLGVYEAA